MNTAQEIGIGITLSILFTFVVALILNRAINEIEKRITEIEKELKQN